MHCGEISELVSSTGPRHSPDVNTRYGTLKSTQTALACGIGINSIIDGVILDRFSDSRTFFRIWHLRYEDHVPRGFGYDLDAECWGVYPSSFLPSHFAGVGGNYGTVTTFWLEQYSLQGHYHPREESLASGTAYRTGSLCFRLVRGSQATMRSYFYIWHVLYAASFVGTLSVRTHYRTGRGVLSRQARFVRPWRTSSAGFRAKRVSDLPLFPHSWRR
ncbi:hypothetical protein VTN00DRAFT_2227 [Thermoascus crustaceus]|uniref:uncharacterized protein n=1 Tax=Thermoascus crustaceus TaxID=5088 RepID=UPI0037425FCA